MLILAINTASSRTGIALFENHVPGNVLTQSEKSSLDRSRDQLSLLAQKSWPARNNEAEKLMPAIDELLGRRPYSSIKQIYVIKGPGSFTGLRVGITVANTIANLTGAEIFAPSTFEYWHSQTELPILIYAGSGGVYLSENSTSQPLIVNLPDLNTTLNSKKIETVTGDITDAQIDVLKKAKFKKLKSNFASAMKSIVTKNLQNHFLTPVKLVKPLYIKEPSISMPACSTSFPRP